MDLTEFVIDNCVRQSATEPKDYIGMTLACGYALNVSESSVQRGWIRAINVLELGRLINQQPNLSWRVVKVHFANGNEGVDPHHIDRLIRQLIDNQENLTPEEFYWEFERIHPFHDGNGRVGAILYSLLKKEFWVNPPEMTW